jgi:hypothetical protein
MSGDPYVCDWSNYQAGQGPLAVFRTSQCGFSPAVNSIILREPNLDISCKASVPAAKLGLARMWVL